MKKKNTRMAHLSMVETMMIQKKRYIIALTSLLFFYIFFPFFNGLGCNYSFESNDPSIVAYGSCHAGIFSIIQIERNTGMVVKRNFIYGRSGHYIYAIKINQEILNEKRRLQNGQVGQDYLYQYIEDIYRDRLIRVFYFEKAKSSPSKYIVVSEKPVENIVQITLIGKLSFL